MKASPDKITALFMSDDQRRLYTCNASGEILLWQSAQGNEEEGKEMYETGRKEMRKCNRCHTFFGLLDKKLSCALCTLLFCSNCCASEVSTPSFCRTVPQRRIAFNPLGAGWVNQREEEEQSVSEVFGKMERTTQGHGIFFLLTGTRDTGPSNYILQRIIIL